jgi:CTP:molybdopterin cytidylyltransferase MocA
MSIGPSRDGIPVAAVVLAAGSAQRFGGPKLLAPFRGRPLAAYSLDAARRAREAGLVHGVVLVIAAADLALAGLGRQAGATIVENEAAERGLASSLQRGLDTLGSDIGAVLVMLADQPLVRVEVLAGLVAAWRARDGALFRPRYDAAPDQPGHPVLADRSLWPLARTLSGDRGFGALLPPGSPSVVTIDVAGQNPDVDTPDDLASLERLWS